MNDTYDVDAFNRNNIAYNEKYAKIKNEWYLLMTDDTGQVSLYRLGVKAKVHQGVTPPTQWRVKTKRLRFRQSDVFMQNSVPSYRFTL